MKRAGTLKKTLLALVGLLAVFVVLLFTLDLGFLKNTIEQQVRDATGRSFEIEGDLSIRLGNELRITSSELVLGNTAWAGETPILQITDMTVVVDSRSVWKGPLLIRQLELDGVDISLEQDDTGRANWVLGKSDASAPDQELPILLESLSIKGANIGYKGPQLDEPVQAEISSLVQNLEADGLLHAKLAGTLSNRGVSFAGTAGPYSRLISGTDFEVKGNGNLGDISIGGNAVFDNLWFPQRPEYELNVTGPELAELTEMFGINGLGNGDLSFSANGAVENELLVSRLNGNFGEFQLDITASVPSLQEASGASVNAQISGPNFGRVARLLDLEGWPEGRFDMNAQVQKPGNGLQIDVFEFSLAGTDVSLSGVIPEFPRAGGSEINLVVSGKNLDSFRELTGLPSLPEGEFSLEGDVSTSNDGQTRIDLAYATPLASGTLAGVVGEGESLVGSDLDLLAAGEDAAAVGQLFEIDGLAKEPWSTTAGISIEHPEHARFSGARFTTTGVTAELEGVVGTTSIEKHTDVQFSVSGEQLSDFQALAGNAATLPEQPFSLSGRATAELEAWQLKGLSGNAGSTSFSLDGMLGKGPSMAGSDLQISAEGTDLGKMFSIPGEARLPDGPFQISSRLRLGDDRIELSDVDAKAGALVFKLDADLPWPLDFTRGEFKLESSGQNITRVLPELAGLDLDEEDYEIHASGNWQEGKVTIGEGQARIGDSHLRAAGTLDMPPNLSATNLSIEASSPDLSRLGTIDGNRWGTVPFNLKTQFSGTPNKFSMEQFQARLGESQVLGTFDIDFEPATPVFSLRFTTNVLNLKPFQVDPAEGAPGEEKKDEDSAGEPGQRLIPDLVFPMEALSKFEGDFAFIAEQVLLKRVMLQNNAVTGEVRNGELTINEMGTDGYQGRLSAMLSLVPLPEGGASMITRATSTGLIINLSRQAEEEKKALPAFDVDINLAGNGTSLREAAASLGGYINVNSPGGVVKNRKAESVSGLFLAEIVAAISPSESRKEEINISCFAAVMKAEEGVISLDPGIAIQSDKLNVYATGNIQLASEKIDVNFRTETRSAAKLSASELISPYVKLSGTLSDPSVALDPKGTLLSGGAAYLSGGLSILAKKALGSLATSKDPCAEHLEKAGN